MHNNGSQTRPRLWGSVSLLPDVPDFEKMIEDRFQGRAGQSHAEGTPWRFGWWQFRSS